MLQTTQAVQQSRPDIKIIQLPKKVVTAPRALPTIYDNLLQAFGTPPSCFRSFWDRFRYVQPLCIRSCLGYNGQAE